MPAVGLALNPAVGRTTAVPVTALVESPLPGVENRTALVNAPALTVVNWMVTLVEPKAGRLKLPPERLVNGPAVMVMAPSLITALPVLVITKLAWAMAPVTRRPKSIWAGVTTMSPGMKLTPAS